MDILYVVGRGSIHWNDELKYSLRSLEKYGKNVGKVYIVGYLPEFVDPKKVTFIPCPDKFKCKHHNIWNCIETAIEESDISTEFLLSSDDHYYIKETDFDNYPYYRQAKFLPTDVSKKDKTWKYHQSLVNTHNLLMAADLPTNRFCWHGNTHFNKDVMKELLMQYLIEVGYHMPQGVEPTCLMLNYQLTKHPFEITDRVDCKIPANTTEEDFLKLIKDRECFSSSTRIAVCVLNFLAKEFPNRSKYEKA